MRTDQTIQENFDALYQIAITLNALLEPNELLERVLEIAMTRLSAERGFIILSNPDKELGYEVTVIKNFSSRQTTSEFAASSSVVKNVLETGEAVLTFDAQNDERFDSSTSIISQNILSIICIPLQTGNRTSGVVYLDSGKMLKEFTEESLKFLTIFGNLAGIAIENAKRYTELQKQNERLKNEAEVTYLFSTLVGTSKKWVSALEIARRVLDIDVSVLITGESGTGKELLARAIHENGARKGLPFVAVNCSAIPESLIESELFGHAKGAFTGAHTIKKGLVEVADQGTLFLDEISDLPYPLQSKLLRLLQEKEYRRVGDTINRTANIRIIAATSRDLKDDVKNAKMREDLYFRLNVVGIHLPPLRERKDDIPLLARHFLQRTVKLYNRPVESIHPEVMQMLFMNPWKGNVREFQNAIERAIVLCNGTQLTVKDFAFDVHKSDSALSSSLTLEEMEKQVIEATLEEMKGNRRRTAEKLGVSLRWLQYRLKEWNQE
ncbi:MAG: sigma-54-dependent Fis family transcriptional regulator [Ignavibacteriae bacterium]|nr:MAG: sigma-54-dependent Fis family transcriptional regulator [Ignavibacteriota bacterium]